jgi:hypothetical protein
MHFCHNKVIYIGSSDLNECIFDGKPFLSLHRNKLYQEADTSIESDHWQILDGGVATGSHRNI